MLPSNKTYKCISFFNNGKPCLNNSKNGMYCHLHVPSKSRSLDVPNINIDISKIAIKIPIGGTTLPCRVNIREVLGECLICNDPVYIDNDAQLKCKHRYHFDCVCNFRKSECPTCRRPLDSPLVNCNLLEIINDRTIADEKAYDDERFREFIRNEMDEDSEIAIEELEQSIIHYDRLLTFLMRLHHYYHHPY